MDSFPPSPLDRAQSLRRLLLAAISVRGGWCWIYRSEAHLGGLIALGKCKVEAWARDVIIASQVYGEDFREVLESFLRSKVKTFPVLASEHCHLHGVPESIITTQQPRMEDSLSY